MYAVHCLRAPCLLLVQIGISIDCSNWIKGGMASAINRNVTATSSLRHVDLMCSATLEDKHCVKPDTGPPESLEQHLR